jgi:hypothetical protein
LYRHVKLTLAKFWYQFKTERSRCGAASRLFVSRGYLRFTEEGFPQPRSPAAPQETGKENLLKPSEKLIEIKEGRLTGAKMRLFFQMPRWKQVA